MTKYIDIGVNLTDKSFARDIDDVVDRAVKAGVKKLIITGTTIEHSKQAIDICGQYPDILYSTAGVHPHHADHYNPAATDALRQISQQACVVAIGECGLDYNRNFSTPENQRRAFASQLALAVETQMPVFLHQRDAHDDFLAMVKEYRADLSDAVAHCFTGTVKEAIEYLELGMFIGVTGWICDERRGESLRQAVREIPLGKIMLETDAPYLLPRTLDIEPVMKRRNEPCFLPHICDETARYMGVAGQVLATAAIENSERFFRV